jgi:uncharacterized SAM-binding protein YcdF (DUF218 family)
MLMLLGFPADRIIVEDKANSTVQNARFSVPLAKEAGTSGIILVTSTTHQGRADGDFADAGGNLLATVSYPDGNPSVNVVQFARDAISPFVNVRWLAPSVSVAHANMAAMQPDWFAQLTGSVKQATTPLEGSSSSRVTRWSQR